MLISVVLCTYNPDDELLARALDAILAQDLDRTAWDLLIVDNNSHPGVTMRKCVTDRGVRVATESIQGLSAARECGVRGTQGSILVFVDDDNLIAPDYLSNVRAAFADQRIGVVSGAIGPEYEKRPGEWFADFESMLAIRRPRTDRAYLTSIPLFSEYFPVGAGMAVRRDVIRSYYQSIADGAAYLPGRVGSELSSGEDTDIAFFAISRGYLVGTIGSLKLLHVIPASRTTPKYISRLAIASTRSAAEVNTKWSGTFGGDVFESFSMSPWQVRFRCAAAALLSWHPRARVRYYYYKTLSRLSDRIK